MRHRAAIGLTENTDAAVVVVSEETGRVSLISNGRVFPATDEDAILRQIYHLFDITIDQSVNAFESNGVINDK